MGAPVSWDIVKAQLPRGWHELAEELGLVRGLVERHVELTGSVLGREVLDGWKQLSGKVVRVVPNDYRRVLEAQRKMRETGMSQEEAEMAAFELNAQDAARVGGK